MAAAAEQGMYFAEQPAAYGAMYDAAGLGQKPLGGLDAKGPFLRGQRRRLNIQPLFLCVIAPWATYMVVLGVLSFSMHHDTPTLCYTIVSLTALAIAGVGFLGLTSSGRWFSNAEHEPTWLIFLFGSMSLAFVAAFAMGSMNYSDNLERYFNLQNLNNYTDVYPTRVHGQQLMDAGMVEFAPGTHLDISKSNGFRNNDIYCVVPITIGNATLATYDFWAVGKNCCSGSRADFHCANFNNPRANGGLRLMVDTDRAFYRLAVQEAEATYGIKAVHPLFFHWDAHPLAIAEGWKLDGRNNVIAWSLAYLIFQTFSVSFATLAFAKMGHL